MELICMATLSSMLFLAAALSTDIFTACFIYGAGHVRIPPLSAAVMIASSVMILSVSQLLGVFLYAWLPKELPAFIGSSLMVLLGAMRLNSGSPEDTALYANRTRPEVLSCPEALFLGISLSADNAAAGLGAGVSGRLLPWLPFFSLLISTLSVTGGWALGKKAAERLPFDPSKAGGIILLLLGLWKLA